MGTAHEQLLIFISTPLYIVVIGAELLLSHLSHHKSYTVKDTIQNVYLMLVNFGLDLLVRSIYIGIILAFFFCTNISSLNWSIF